MNTLRAVGALVVRKRLFITKAISVTIIACLVVGYSLWANAAAEADAAVQAQILEAEKAASRGPYTTDGVYTGSAEGYGGTVEMQVTIENGYIEDVQILSAEYEDAPYLEETLVLLDEILQEQTSSIDVVSGCTYTSCGILNGVTEALKKSLAGEASEGQAA